MHFLPCSLQHLQVSLSYTFMLEISALFVVFLPVQSVLTAFPTSLFSMLFSCRCTFWSEQHPRLEATQCSSGEAAGAKTGLKMMLSLCLFFVHFTFRKHDEGNYSSNKLILA